RVLDMAEIQKSLRDLEADGISPALRQELQDLILQGATPMEVFRSSHRKAYKERAAKVAEMANKLPPTSLQRISDRLNARGDFADVKPIGSSRLNAVLDSVNTYLKDVGGDFDGPVQRLFLDNPMGFSEALGSLTKLAQHLGPNSAEFRDAISIAMASKQTYDMLERLTSLAAAVKSSADAEQLMPKLKEYLAKALADGDEQWRDSLQRMGDITKKNGESMNADITQALQSGDAFAGVRPKAAVPEDLQGTKAKIEAVETEGAEPEAIKAAQEAASAEVRKWHDFLMGSFKTEDGRELAVADSYRKLVEFLQHKDGPHLSDADIQAGLRQALERLVREGKELTVDNVRHAVKDDFKRQLLTWTLTGDMGGTRSDFDPTDPRAVGESINRLNKLTELSGEGEGDNVALNPKDRANLTEEWHEIYKNGLKVEGEEHIGTQAVLREKENGTMVGEKTIRGVDSEGKPTERVVELPGTRSGERKPDFSDPPLLGDVKSHKDSLSGEDEIRLRAYLRAVSAENGVTVHVKGQKLDTPFDQVRVFFTDSQGVIASAQRLAALMNDYPDHFSFAFIHPVTGERHVIGPQSTNPIPGVPAGRAMTEAQLKAEIDRIIKGATPPS
ncbi:MAG: hypothetical protein PVI52_09275, partial [Chromatiales bacterium]